MKKLVLASASPRRRELLEQIDLKPEIIAAQTDEETGLLQPDEMVRELAHRKCLAVAAYLVNEADVHKEQYVIGADTVVVHRGQILGKPKNSAEAETMLRSLQGDTHQVFTGVCVLHLDFKKSIPAEDAEHMRLFHVCTEVTVNPMSEEEIQRYVDSGEPLDKAGAYGIQGKFARHISGICGDYTNVVGLPVSAVYNALQDLQYYDQPIS